MIALGTKAETLKELEGKLKYAKILPQYTFTVEQWKEEKQVVWNTYNNISWNNNVIVRSSALSEDGIVSSGAGKYQSIANVRGFKEFCEAVEVVIHSYDNNELKDQILVQPMLEEVVVSGVAFTLEPNSLGNYYVINYDVSGSTDSITSGQGKNNFLYYHFKNSSDLFIPNKLKNLVKALKEIEGLCKKDNLDIEFAVTEKKEIYILQVRTLCVKGERLDVRRQNKFLTQIYNKIQKSQSSKPFLCGDRTVYSVMTDWNPAEMIGTRPRPLALSLYKELITDAVWAYQRDNYGYRNLRSFPLMVDFGGLPYIDVRVSFNSFVPADLEKDISEKLVNYYIQSLIDNPKKHDKAEFEIIFSCYTFDLEEKIQLLKQHGFTEVEIDKILKALRNVTNSIINYENGLWRKDLEKIIILEERYHEIVDSEIDDIEKIYWLLEDCKRYGTLPFAGLARAGFIAVQLLKSMVSCEIIHQSDYEAFMKGLNTVSSNMNGDFAQLSQKEFLKKYGHLRPGTYDITSVRYDDEPEIYFDWKEKRDIDEKEKEIFRLSMPQLNALRASLKKNGLNSDVLELMDFIKSAIEGREYGKYAFTKNLSKAIQLLENVGKREGISREECSFINIKAIYDLYSSTRDIKTYLIEQIEKGAKEYNITESVCLPPLITEAKEVYSFYYPDSEPNYITSGKVIGDVYCLENITKETEIVDKIVLIPCADPGYDWIFSKGIRGFVTMYGGANSHMAIRAGELGIPAVIGIGNKRFKKFKAVRTIEIDCLSKTIRVLKED